MLLINELEACGFERGEEKFRKVVMSAFAQLHGNWTDEDLLCSPRDALHYCNTVRLDAGAPDAPDRLILRTLTNCRKAGRWAPKKKRIAKKLPKRAK